MNLASYITSPENAMVLTRLVWKQEVVEDMDESKMRECWEKKTTNGHGDMSVSLSSCATALN
jgi:hypothetical protein